VFYFKPVILLRYSLERRTFRTLDYTETTETFCVNNERRRRENWL